MINPQNRYLTSLTTKKLSNGKVVYRSLIPKSIKPNFLSDVQITATDTTRMDKLAFNMYGSALEWWKIASANGRVDGSLFFRPGTTIVVPSK